MSVCISVVDHENIAKIIGYTLGRADTDRLIMSAVAGNQERVKLPVLVMPLYEGDMSATTIKGKDFKFPQLVNLVSQTSDKIDLPH